MGCLLDGLRAFVINADLWTTVAPGEGEWCKTEEQRVECSMVNWIAAKKSRAGLRYVVVCVTSERDGKDKMKDNPKEACSC